MHEIIFIVAAALLVSLLLLWFTARCRLYRRCEYVILPPSPPKLPVLGNLHQLGSLPHQSLNSLARKYGPIVLLQCGSVPALVVSSPDAALEIMRSHDATFADRPKYKAFNKLLYNSKDVSFSPYGNYWRKMKSIFVHQLLSSKRVESLRSIREQETALLVKRIQRQPPGHPLNLTDMFSELAYNGIYRSVFGGKHSQSDNGRIFSTLMMEFMDVLGTISIADFVPWLAWVTRVNGFDKRVDDIFKRLDDFLAEVIEEHLKGESDEKGDNFVDVLIHCLKENSCGGSIDRDAIKALILDVFSAGTDTMSAVLEWIMVELLRNPMVMERLKKQVQEIAKDRHNIKDEDLREMHYLKAVIKETLRYHPPKPLLVPRVARQDVKVKGYSVKAGTIVMTNAWAIGRDPSHWDEPQRFEPDRFLNSKIDFKGVHFELIPFGAGRRGCPGITFSMATIELVIANLVDKFEWGLPGGAQVKDMDMTERFGGTVRRAKPLLAIVTPLK